MKYHCTLSLVVCFVCISALRLFEPCRFVRKTASFARSMADSSENFDAVSTIDKETIVEISSPKIAKFERQIVELEKSIEEVRAQKLQHEATLQSLDREYGGEIERVKREFARIKERAIEESRELTIKAKVDAVKEILPITDNYLRAKQVFQPLQSENEKVILDSYDTIFGKLEEILEEFGAKRVVSVGQPFDFNFMEAIMQAPSTEYASDIVTTEYQIGYRMGDKLIRPAIVVVSTGPGPQ